VLILVRGVPGTGKSTLVRSGNLARQLNLFEFDHFEADMYFDHGGLYKFDASKLPSAHGWCQAETYRALKEGRTVVVSNTFTTMKEMEPYIKMAEDLNLRLTIVTMKVEYGSIHNVPEESMQRMRDRFASAQSIRSRIDNNNDVEVNVHCDTTYTIMEFV